MNELGLRFLYKLKSSSSYIDTLDNNEDQIYEENERSIKFSGVYVRITKQRYVEKQMEIEEMNQTQHPPWLVNSILFCYEGDKNTGNESERKQEGYTDG